MCQPVRYAKAMKDEFLAQIKALEGCKIEKASVQDGVEGGFRLDLSRQMTRWGHRESGYIVLGYTELGEWVEECSIPLENGSRVKVFLGKN